MRLAKALVLLKGDAVVRNLEQLVHIALEQYLVYNPDISFIRHNENYTCKVVDGCTNEEYVLRIHNSAKGFSSSTVQHSFDSLCAELQFIKAIGENTDISVQKPVKNRNGSLVSEIIEKGSNGRAYATLLTWIKGEPMSKGSPEWRIQAYETGVLTAKLHSFSQGYDEGRYLKRHSYDISKLKQTAASIEEAVGLELMDSEHYKLIQKGGERICQLMKELDNSPGSKRLIHADLGKSNLIVYKDTVTPIDFCLCGHGYYYMDLGGLLADADSLQARKAILEGYRSKRELPETDMKYIEGFFVMSVLLCMAAHLHNPKMKDWYLRRTKLICSDYVIPLINDERFWESTI